MSSPSKSGKDCGFKRRLITDLVILFTVLLFALCCYLVYNFALGSGERVEIIIDGEVVASYPLSEDITVELFADGEYSNILVIERGVARISEANCPDGICREHAPIDKDGQTIVCLPHRLVVAARAD